MPLTEAEKAQQRLVKANSYKNTGSGGTNAAMLVGGGGTAEDQEPVEFMHLKTFGRNYAVLQVGLVGKVRSRRHQRGDLLPTQPIS